MPPNQVLWVTAATPGTEAIWARWLMGSPSMIEYLGDTLSRSTPATSTPLSKASATERSRPNSRKAAMIENRVRKVRALRRNRLLQIKEKPLMPEFSLCGESVPCLNSGRLWLRSVPIWSGEVQRTP